MAKKPLPITMDPANVGHQPPFVPMVFKTTVGPQPPKGTNYEASVGLYAKLYDYAYCGLNQTSHINTAKPMPPWEDGPRRFGAQIGSSLVVMEFNPLVSL
jgi:hypothetical protein